MYMCTNVRLCEIRGLDTQVIVGCSSILRWWINILKLFWVISNEQWSL